MEPRTLEIVANADGTILEVLEWSTSRTTSHRPRSSGCELISS